MKFRFLRNCVVQRNRIGEKEIVIKMRIMCDGWYFYWKKHTRADE